MYDLFLIEVIYITSMLLCFYTEPFIRIKEGVFRTHRMGGFYMKLESYWNFADVYEEK